MRMMAVVTRSQRHRLQSENGRVIPLYRGLSDDPNDHVWITFSDLYPCIQNDPVQIYLRYHLSLPTGYTSSSSSHIQSKTQRQQEFFDMFRDQLYFVDESWSIPRFRIIQSMLAQNSHENFFSIPCFDFKHRLRVQVDMIVCPSFLRNLGLETVTTSSPPEDEDVNHKRHRIVLLTESVTITTYKRLKAHFVGHVLRRMDNVINLSEVYFLHLPSQKLQRVSIDIDARHDPVRSLRRYCQWIRFCQHHGDLCSLSPPSHPYLFPNMKVSSDYPSYNQWKEAYAEELKEITMLWACHPKHRERMHGNGIYRFDDPAFCPKSLGLSAKDEHLLERMLRLHQSPHETISIPSPQLVWNVVRPMHMDCYVDFETLDGFIYWIGIGYTHPVTKAYTYKAIVSSSQPSLSSEREVMTRFVTWMSQWDAYMKTVYYWWAEIKFWSEAVRRQQQHDNDDTETLALSMEDWVDLCTLFREAPILIKDAWNFKLKTVSKCMRRYGMIEVELPSGCQSGMESLSVARDYFATHSKETYDVLWAYNHFDCTVMYEMVSYLRHHLRNTSLDQHLA